MDIVIGIKQMNLEKFPYEELKETFNNITITDTWINIAQVWQEVDGISSFFYAVGQTFVGLVDNITQIGKVIYSSVEFIVKAFGWLFNNLMTVINFIFTYIITI